MKRSYSALPLLRFAAAVGAEPKWVSNLPGVLGRAITYDVREARRFGLVRELHVAFGTPLRRADALAGRALARDLGAAGAIVIHATGDGSAKITLDVERYLSTFTARLAFALTLAEGRQRGRRRTTHQDPIAAARERGIDIGLLVSSLSLTPAERLERLDQNAAFLASMRRVVPN